MNGNNVFQNNNYKGYENNLNILINNNNLVNLPQNIT